MPTVNPKNNVRVSPVPPDVEVNTKSDDHDVELAIVEKQIPFPVGTLPATVRKLVSEGAESIGCDSSFIALPVLSVLGSAIGNSRRAELKKDWQVPPILWTAIVGESGTAKSPALKLSLIHISEPTRPY